MRPKALIGILFFLVLAGCKAAINSGSAACSPGTHDQEISSGGVTRQYRLHVPPGYLSGKPMPLVLVFHGNRSTAQIIEGYTGLSVLADQEGFIVVYPQASQPSGEPAGWDTWAGSQHVQFVRDLLDKLSASCRFDPARVYATGFSRGGGMVDRLACDLADRIAAVAPVSGTYQYGADCSPSRPIAVAAFHGTDDPDVPYNGIGNLDTPPMAYFSISTPIPQWASAWAGRNGCTSGPSIVFQAGNVTGQGWGDCLAGADVVLYTVNGGGHSWPGGSGSPAGEVNASQLIWDFFVQHPLTSAYSQ